MHGRILDAAARIFSKKGFHRASMDEIAAEAGVAKGSLYYHFHDKSQLFEAMAVRGMESLRGELEQATGLSISIEEKVAAVIDRVSALCLDYPDVFAIVMSEASEGVDPEAWRGIEEAKAGLLEYIAGLLREGCEVERALRPLDYAPVSHALMSFIYTYLRQAAACGHGERVQMMREIREVVMRGILRYNSTQ